MTAHANDDSREFRLERVLADYLHAAEAGAPLDQEELLREHPDLAGELRSFFANRAEMDRLATPLKGSSFEPTVGVTTSPAAGEMPRVRYFGEYELLEEIARGGMGVVYKARQSRLKRIVALKMILSGRLAGGEDVKRFHAEAEAAAKLDHPNIVPIFEIGEHEGQHFFSMAYVEGESLARQIVAGPLPPSSAARLIEKVARAVAYAHVKGVVHRDLKPANVLLDRDGEPRVTDFGLAKQIATQSIAADGLASDADLTATGQILGTPSYMPPEQAAGKTAELGPLADVYSLGAMLYCLVIGRPPFQAASPLDTLWQVLHDEPVAPRQLNPKVPRDLETICLKCLEKDPRRRYAGARELAEDLRRFLNGEPVKARPLGRSARAWRWCRRNPWQAVAGAALVVLVLVASLSTLTLRDRLWRSLLEQARSERYSGQRARSMDLIMEAAAIKRNAELQQAAVDTIVSPGVSQVGELYFGRTFGFPANQLRFNREGNQIAVTGSCLPMPEAGIQAALRIWKFPSGEFDSDRLLTTPEEVIPAMSAFADAPAGKQATPDGAFLDILSIDGRIGVVLGEKQVEIWDLRASRRLATLTDLPGGIKRAAVTCDGNLFAYHSPTEPGAIQVVEVQTGARRKALQSPGHSGEAVLYPPYDNPQPSSGNWFLVNGGGEAVLIAPYESPLDFSADGKLFVAHGAVGAAGVVRIWDIESGELIATIRENYAPQWSRQGHFLATIGRGKEELSGVLQRSSPVSGGGESFRTSRGQTIYQRAGFVNLWKIARPTPTFNLREGVKQIAFAADGRRLLLNNSVREVTATDNGYLVGDSVLQGDGRWVMLRSGRLLSVHVPPNRGHIVVQSPLDNWKVSLQHPGYSQELYPRDKDVLATNSLDAFAISPDGTQMACAFQIWTQNTADAKAGPGTVNEHSFELWDLVKGKQLATWNKDDLRHKWKAADGLGDMATFSPDGTHVAIGGSHLALWDVATGTRLFDCKSGGKAAHAAFSPDGKWIYAVNPQGGTLDGVVYVVDSASGRLFRSWNGQRGGMPSLAVSTAGHWLACGGHDRTIRIWKASSGAELARWTAHDDDVTALAFSPDDKVLASGSLDGTVKFWHLPTIRGELARIGLDWQDPD